MVSRAALEFRLLHLHIYYRDKPCRQNLRALRMQETDMEEYIPAVSVEAYRQLLQLNIKSYKPEVADWLHSEEAETVLIRMLAAVPCSSTLH
jgi:hypothetical protein